MRYIHYTKLLSFICFYLPSLKLLTQMVHCYLRIRFACIIGHHSVGSSGGHDVIHLAGEMQRNEPGPHFPLGKKQKTCARFLKCLTNKTRELWTYLGRRWSADSLHERC